SAHVLAEAVLAGQARREAAEALRESVVGEDAVHLGRQQWGDDEAPAVRGVAVEAEGLAGRIGALGEILKVEQLTKALHSLALHRIAQSAAQAEIVQDLERRLSVETEVAVGQ